MSKLIALLFLGSAASAFSVPTKKQNRLEKVTIGPFDNYQSSVDAKGVLYHTKSVNLVTHIHKQNPDGASEQLLDESAHAKNPVLSPDGKYLAFHYFKHDARGDVCFFPVVDTDAVTCVESAKGRDSSPTWVGKDKIAFLEQDLFESEAHLKVYDIKTKQTEEWETGVLSSPAGSHDGSLLAFQKYNSSRQVWELFVGPSGKGKERRKVNVELPGVMGFLAFTTDDAFLYFSHYLNDTNFDQSIDANDHSVIFRMPVSSLLKKDTNVFPEQLTSVASNCNFPSLTKDHLYVTCAFENTLDVYRLPLGGQIPKDWTKEDLWQSHAASRSHEERLLVLNTMRYRFPKSFTKFEWWERVTSNHLQIGETTSALFYVDKLIDAKSKSKTYQLLRSYLKSYEWKRQDPTKVPSLKLRKQLERELARLKRIDTNEALKSLVISFVHHFMGENAQAKHWLKGVSPNDGLSSLERNLQIKLANVLYQGKERFKRVRVYAGALRDKTLDEEARVYYTFQLLKLWHRVYGQDFETRQKAIRNILTKNEDVKALLDFEYSILAFLQMKSEAEEKKAFRKINSAMVAQRKHYHLSRAMYVRAIKNLSEAEKFYYMGQVASKWLRFTKTDQAEFEYAAAQYTYANMDRAYGKLTSNQSKAAGDIFYLGIRQTDDLEAHYGMSVVRLATKDGAKKWEEVYADLIKREITGENFKYAQALRLLIQDKEFSDSSFTSAKELLEGMGREGFNQGLRFQLLGYVYHRRLLQTAEGFAYDKELFKKAHRQYMIALDMGHDNIRSRMALLANLAHLHFFVGNQDISVSFFRKRDELPFLDLNDELSHRWFFAKALFYSERHDEAVEQIKRGLALIENPKLKLAFEERLAFYTVYGGDYKTGVKNYDTVLAKKDLDDVNHAKAIMMRGFAYFKLGEAKKAEADLESASEFIQRWAPESYGVQKKIDRRPERLLAIVYGLLARLQTNDARRISFREKRLAQLKEIEGKFDVFVTNESVWAEQITKERLKLVELNGRVGNTKEQQKHLGDTFHLLRDEDPIQPLLYRVLLASLASGLQKPEAYRDFQNDFLKETISKALKGFDEIKEIPSGQVFKRWKLELFWHHYQRKVLGVEKSLAVPWDEDLLQRLKEDSSEKFEMLKNFDANLN